MIKLKEAVVSIFSRRAGHGEDLYPECFERLNSRVGEREDQRQAVVRAEEARKVAQRKYAAVKRAIRKEERTMKAFGDLFWGVRGYSIYRSPDGEEWVLESADAAAGCKAIAVEILSPERFKETIGGDEPYEARVYVHWHERRYLPIGVKAFNREGLAEGLIAATERGGPYAVTRQDYKSWMCCT